LPQRQVGAFSFLFKKAAKERQKEGGKAGGKKAGRGRPRPDRVAETFGKPNGRSRAPSAADEVATVVGASAPTLAKAQFVAAKAEEQPDLYRPIADEMEQTGKVDRAFKKAKRQEALGPVPLAEVPKSPPTVAERVGEICAAFRAGLLGVQQKHGEDWAAIVAGTGPQQRKHLLDYNVGPLHRSIAALFKELAFRGVRRPGGSPAPSRRPKPDAARSCIRAGQGQLPWPRPWRSVGLTRDGGARRPISGESC
jgi:hypothetical protein